MNNIEKLKPLLRNSNKQTNYNSVKTQKTLRRTETQNHSLLLPADSCTHSDPFYPPFHTDRIGTTCLHSNLSDLTFLLFARTLQMDATANSYYRNAVWMCLFHCRNIFSENSICANIFHVLFLFFLGVNKYIFTPFVTMGINGKIHNRHIFQVISSVIKV